MRTPTSGVSSFESDVPFESVSFPWTSVPLCSLDDVEPDDEELESDEEVEGALD